MKVAISKCLCGSNCRYNGTNKLTNQYNLLQQYFSLVPFCPEETLGVPRVPIDRYKDGKIISKDNIDYTDILIKNSKDIIDNIEDISGIILKSKSPSCGVDDTKIYSEDGTFEYGSGIFTTLLNESIKDIAIIDERRLEDEFERLSFILDTLSFYNIKNTKIVQNKELVTFHTRHKFILLAHSRVLYDKLGNIVANHEKIDIEEVIKSYKKLFLETINNKITQKNLQNSLYHLAGFLKKYLDKDEKEVLHKAIAEYKNFDSINILNKYSKKYNVVYLENQYIISMKYN
jgi:uncharacterized protein YbbK (DUF523 family)/uncharacterized protein YbgA (DUF1722 family)